MAYFPMFVQLKKKKCLVIGGGKIALRKIEVLKDFEADITVIAPEMITQIRQIDQICRIFRTFMEKDFNEADFVIAATDDQKINQPDLQTKEDSCQCGRSERRLQLYFPILCKRRRSRRCIFKWRAESVDHTVFKRKDQTRFE